ncbi:cytosine permease [Lentibacillus salinarum]|uniref:Cytosine permease n=1 Tax=Lentibacillus salinarum TaxID=446820 RepID=A0ABW3ZY31_9BACI
MSKNENDFAREPVPEELRKGWLSIASVWIAVGIDLSAMLLGAQLGAGMPFGKAILAVVIGSVFLGLLGAFCAYIGYTTGLSTAMISTFVFGKQGAKFISFCLGVSLLGWFGVQAGFFAENAHAAIQSLLGIDVPVKVLALIGGLLMMTTAIYGYRAIEKLSKFSVPFLILLIVAALSVALNEKGTDDVLQTTGNTFSFGAATSLVIGVFVVGTIISPDIARWAKTKKDAVLSAFFGFLIGNSFMLVMAIVLSKAMNTSDLTVIFIALGMGIPAIIVLTLAQWTTNTNNLYSSSLGLAVLLPKIPKKILTILAGLFATLFAVLGIFDHFVVFLNFITVFIAPVGGIYAAEYYLVNKHNFRFDNEHQPSFITRSLVVWIIASGIALLTTESPAGMELFQLTSIPAIDGFIAAFALQWLVEKLLYSNQNQQNLNKGRYTNEKIDKTNG